MADLVLTDLSAKGDLNIHVYPDSAGNSAARHQLPAVPTLSGREQELARIDAAVGAPARLLIHGMPGVGKSAFALAVAHRLASQFPDAQIVIRGTDSVSRSPLRPEKLMVTVIQAFRPAARLPPTVDELQRMYLSVLTEAGRALVVFDDVVNADQARSLTPPSNCCFILASRQRFTLPDSIVVHLRCLEAEAGRALLLKLAPRVETHAETAARTCGGLPLALVVLAGIVNEQTLTPVEDLLATLQREFARSGVTAAFKASYTSMPRSLRKQWTLLALFRVDFQLSAAAAVWHLDESTARACLQRLVSASLVQYDPAHERFSLHSLIRQFCEQHQSGFAVKAARLYYAEFFLIIGERALALIMHGGDDFHRGLALFDQERPDIDATLLFLDGKRPVRHANWIVRIGALVGELGSLRFSPEQRVHWLTAARAAARSLKDLYPYAIATGNLGNAYLMAGDLQGARPFLDELLMIARKIEDRVLEGNALNSLGIIERLLGRPQEGIPLIEERLRIARETADQGALQRGLNNLGNLYSDMKQFEKAFDCIREALALSEREGDALGRARSLTNLGRLHLESGQFDRALECFNQRLVIAQSIGDVEGEALSWANLSEAWEKKRDRNKQAEMIEHLADCHHRRHERRGESKALRVAAALRLELLHFDQALALLGRRTPLICTEKEYHDQVGILNNLGAQCIGRGEMREGKAALEQALGVVSCTEDQKEEANVLGNLGILYSRLGDASNAITFHQRALELDRKVGCRPNECADLLNLANAYSRSRDYGTAYEYYKLQHTLARDIRDQGMEAQGLWNWALALHEDGQHDQAHELGATAIALSGELNLQTTDGWKKIHDAW